MAAATVRATAAAATAKENNTSTPKTTITTDPQRRHRQQPHHDTTRRNLDNRHRLSNFLCADCLCHTSGSDCTSSSSDSPAHRWSSLSKPKRRRLSDIDNETLDFRYSYSTAVCNCTKCPRQDYNFHHVNSFSKSHISTSTAVDYSTTTAAANTTCRSTDEPFTPPREYTTNTRALGILTEKCSPLFGPAKGISLRTQEPYYSDYLVCVEDFKSPKSLQKYKENIDYTATEALLSMNGGKKSVNGSVITSTAGNGVTDINRNNNNGVPKHWVSVFFYY